MKSILNFFAFGLLVKIAAIPLFGLTLYFLGIANKEDAKLGKPEMFDIHDF